MQAAAEWDAITEKIGVDKQKAVYKAWASKSGAYPKCKPDRLPASDRPRTGRARSR